jgi:hypothetical protein
MSFRPFQKASSRLTLVLWPAMTIERLTTGDFISFSPFDPMLVEIPARLRVTGCFEFALGFWPPVGKAIFGGAFCCVLSVGLFAGRAKIDQFSHACS